MPTGFGSDFFDAALGMAQEPISSFLGGQADPHSDFGALFAGQTQPQSGASSTGSEVPTGNSLLGSLGDYFSGAAFTGPEASPYAQSGSSTMYNQTTGVKEAQDMKKEEVQKAASQAAVRIAHPGLGSGAVEPNRNSAYYGMAQEAARRYGVDPDVFSRQISWESGGFDPDVINGNRRSSAGAVGIAQFMPATARSLGIDPLNPVSALDGAAKYMAQLLKKYGSYPVALRAYNEGEGGVDSGAAISDEGATYLARILGTGPPVPSRTGLTPGGPSSVYPGVNPQGAIFPVIGYTGDISPHGGPGNIGGSDIMAAAGTPVVSMRAGTVAATGTNRPGDPGGNWVLINGDDGLQYYYAHLQATPQVASGQQVAAGQELGAVGTTGNAAGGPPHLHLGIGYGITQGVGGPGGLGQNYDAVAALRALLGLP